MCNEDVKKNKGKRLSENQKYQVGSMVFIVQPIFNENSNKTLGEALINLMNEEISKK